MQDLTGCHANAGVAVAQGTAQARYNRLAAAAAAAHLNLVPNAVDGKDATYWKGFAPTTAVGLRLEKLPAAN